MRSFIWYFFSVKLRLEVIKMNLFLKRIAILSVFLMIGQAEAYTATDMNDFVSASQNCDQFDAFTVINFSLRANMTVAISADPNQKGNCLLSVTHSEAAPIASDTSNGNSSTSSSTATTSPAVSQSPTQSYKCSLSKALVDKFLNVSSELAANLDNPGTETSADVKAVLAPIEACVQKNAPKPKIIPSPVPAGAVPAGTPLLLPNGIVAAPGTVPLGTPPGMIPTTVPTSSVPTTAAPAAGNAPGTPTSPASQ
jgi:hypothetical protein